MNINNIKSTFGYIGFLPFAFFCIIPWIFGGTAGDKAIIFQIAYGSIILSFLAGIPWGWRDDLPNQSNNLTIGIVYSLIACSMLILVYINKILPALLISIIAFQSFYYFEKSTYDFQYKHEDYQKFRRMLSLLVAISFLISTAYWINPYSNPIN